MASEPSKATPRSKRGPAVPGRKASRAFRRQQLIDATIDSLARRGYSDTTLADVAEGAGLSRGIVNFHFESKEKLLVETLNYLSREYADHWAAALQKAGDDPAARLWALVSADFDRKICTRRKLAAWCAFWGEARSRPTYQALCGQTDDEYNAQFVSICTALKEQGGYDIDPFNTAVAICAMMEGLWLRLMFSDDVTREKALACARDFLIRCFDRHFTADGPVARVPEPA